MEAISIEEPVEKHSINLVEFTDMYVQDMYHRLEDIFPKESDQRIADAVLNIFSQRNDLEIFKKKALYIYIREMTDCKTPNLTSVINTLKREFYETYYEKLDEGLLVI
jgi:hypothetical protein